MSEYLRRLARDKDRGIASICSVHPLIIEATLRGAQNSDDPVLIEATCNQVNHQGGYTGMTPSDFRDFVFDIAARFGVSREQIILGGDHLGPNPWKHLPAEEAMIEAGKMVKAYREAGFTKIHLDTSMGCKGEPVALDDEMTASRATQLANISEAVAGEAPVYVIGTEVPVPGGATHVIEGLEVTKPKDAQATWEVHQKAFVQAGLEAALDRVIAMVVQPGVEFNHDDVVHYDPSKAQALSSALEQFSNLTFEAHSTDYQRAAGLRALVNDGFSILKVGPWLTFAMREAFYGLDAIADALEGRAPQNQFMKAMEDVMLEHPKYWESYYHGDSAQKWLLRHFSYSDRIRYYWTDHASQTAVRELFNRLDGKTLPAPLISQYLPILNTHKAYIGAHEAVIDAISNVLDIYQGAVAPLR